MDTSPDPKFPRPWHPQYDDDLMDIETKLTKGQKTDIRVSAFKDAGERWGSGLDEEIATRMQLQLLKKGKVDPDLASVLTWTRERTADLIWKTGNDEIAGHPGALKKLPQLRGFVVSEHNTRDRARGAGVKTELDAYDQGNATAHDVAIKARLMTVKHMMSPAEELRNGKSLAYTHDDSIPQLNQPGAVDKLAQFQQSKRELIKWETASYMMQTGHKSLVPKTYKDYLTSSQHKITNAMNAFSADVFTNKTVPNTATTSRTDTLRDMTMKQMSSAPLKTRPRALSDPRRI